MKQVVVDWSASFPCIKAMQEAIRGSRQMAPRGGRRLLVLVRILWSCAEFLPASAFWHLTATAIKKSRKMNFPQHEKAKGFVVLVPLGAVSRHGGAVGFGTARGFSYDVKIRVCTWLSVCLDHHT